MKISFNWLKEYIDTNCSAQEVSNILTDLGLEVEKMEQVGLNKEHYNDIVTGKVISCEKHPDADRLHITKVDVGVEILQIVCGAPNIALNQYVPVAKVGSKLFPQGEEVIKIKKARIRGVESLGMICSQKELGISNQGDGIWVIDKCESVGDSIVQYMELDDDYVFEIGLTPNRSDALGITGVARDLAAYLNFHKQEKVDVAWPTIEKFKKGSKSLQIDITVKNDACFKYLGLSIAGVKVEESPKWLQKKLEKVGINAINNVVDITNYVMMELGTPLHAFDANKINGNIVVQNVRENTSFKALDGNTYTLNGHELMITNGELPLCIAGVMGGLDSGIDANTSNIFLESAIFDPISVRKTAKHHGIHSDASFRFERGVDPNLTLVALHRAASLIMDIAGGEIGMETTVIENHTFPQNSIPISCNTIRKQIGHDIKDEEIVEILELLDIKIIKKSEQGYLVDLPHYRQDVKREADVIEEVLRVYGYNNIPLPKKMSFSLPNGINNQKHQFERRIAQLLVSNGFYEAMNNSLSKSIEKDENSVRILNPLSQDLGSLRTNLSDGLLSNLAFNQNRQNPNIKLFEFGKVYHKRDNNYLEHEKLALLVSGSKQPESWNTPSKEENFFTMKSYIELVCTSLGINPKILTQEQRDNNLLIFTYKGVLIGEIIATDLKSLKQFNLKNKVYEAVLDMEALLELSSRSIKSKDLPKSFATRRDFALILDKNVYYKDLQNCVNELKINTLIDMNLFDVFEGKNIQDDKKSYAISFLFQDPKNSLQDSQIDIEMDKILQSLKKQFNATLRQ